MIYLDNSATTFPKPKVVNDSMARAERSLSNPGRGGHRLSMAASEELFGARSAAAVFFNARGAENVIFTMNCTHALNIVLKGLLKPGDHAVVSGLEHNAVMRPLEKLSEKGISYTAARVYPCDDEKTISSFRNSINGRTRLIVCTHASNVWGLRMPVERLSALAHEYGIPILVDAAQSAGVIPIDLQRSGIDYLCTAGHKGLYGPMGTGLLILNTKELPESLTEGGTGSNSYSFTQPSEIPDRFESGTPNVAGIAGLHAGISFVGSRTPEKISAHEFSLIRHLYRELSKRRNIRLYLPEPTPDYFVPILSFNVEGTDSESTAQYLGRNGVAVRAGLHCCPAAHRELGTLDTGTVRVSPSAFSSASDIDRLLNALSRMASGKA